MYLDLYLEKLWKLAAVTMTKHVLPGLVGRASR